MSYFSSFFNKKMISCSIESELRNMVVYKECKGSSMKSYYLWNEYDIEKESIEKRILWWENLDAEFVKKNSLDAIVSDVLYKLRCSNIHSEKCTKRNPNVFECDI